MSATRKALFIKPVSEGFEWETECPWLSGQTIGGLTLTGMSIHEGVHCECDGSCGCGKLCGATAVFQIGEVEDETDLFLYVCHICARRLVAKEAEDQPA